MLDRIQWCFWFWKWALRVHAFGHGIYLAWDRQVLFSERYGYRRVYRLWRISLELV